MSAITPLQLFNPRDIPAALKTYARWSPWKALWSEDRGKWDKVPFNAKAPDYGISTAKPDKWVGFEEALKTYDQHEDKFAGLGYLLTGVHGIVGYDFDGCIKDGVTAPWALELIYRLNSYSEISPSGNGVRVFCEGEVEADWTNHEAGIECYAGHRPRFLTVTGQHLMISPAEVNLVPPEVHAEIAAQYRRVTRVAEIDDSNMPELLPDAELPDLELLALSERVKKFLTVGDCHGDRSALLFQTGITLFNCGLNDQQVFSVMVANPFVYEIALEKRRQNADRALLYIWREHCVKAKLKSNFMSPEEFEVIEGEVVDGEKTPQLKQDKNGAFEATIDNVCIAVRSPRIIGYEIRKDTFKDEIVLSVGDDQWRSFRDDDYTRLRVILEKRGFKQVGREMIRDVVELIAVENEFDTAIFWLESLPAWDGVPRIDDFLSRYFGAEVSDYTQAVSRYLWTAMAGRVLAPGIKADMVPVLIGEQGAKKSSAIEAMVPGVDFFCELDIDERREENNSRKMRGCLIAELAELKGLKSRELEYVKSFITRTHEKWIPKFKEFAHTFPRRLVFIGTTNEERFLADDTGNRRWLPMQSDKADLDGIKQVRDLLWSEAREIFNAEGIAFRKAEELAREVHKDHMLLEPWADEIQKWLHMDSDFGGENPASKEFITTTEVLADALRIPPSQRDRWSEMRCGRALIELGYLRVKRRIDGKPRWVYAVPTVPT